MAEFNDENVIDFAERVAAGKIQEATPPEEVEEFIMKNEWVFTNDKADMMIRQMFHMFYQMVFDNKIGLMHAKNKETDQIETLIVGVQPTEDGYACFPIAKVIPDTEQGKYLSPDGAGNYV